MAPVQVAGSAAMRSSFHLVRDPRRPLIFGAVGERSAKQTGPAQPSGLHAFLLTGRAQATLVAVLAFALYANTLGHGFALDDGLVLSDNPYVQVGVAGIPDIVSRDSFHGTLGESAYVSGGRYRPLSLVMFALEVSLFGKGPFAPHLLNVLLYALTAIVLLRLLRRSVFPEHPLAALVAAALFILHPVHSEVVANIKSRDEILSLLFILLTLGYLLRGDGSVQIADRWKAAFCYALALLSKENGIVLLGIAPLALFTFRDQRWPSLLKACAPMALVAALYLGLRFGVLGTRMHEVPGVLDNPYVLATTSEKLATIVHVLAEYFRLLFWPHPLTYDYSYAQVPYRSFGDSTPWLGAALLITLVAFSIRAMVRRDALGWCAAFFLGGWLLVSGLFFNIGAPMAERFMYQASVPFVLALVIIAQRLSQFALSAGARRLATVAIVLVGAAFAVRTVARNADWRNGDDLLLSDVAVSAKSARANTYAGIACIRKGQKLKSVKEQRVWAQRALGYFAAADSIVPDYLPTLMNRGLAHLMLDSLAAAESAWERVRAIEPGNAMLPSYDGALHDGYLRMGLQAGVEHDLKTSIAALEKAVRYGPGKADTWYNLGGAYYTAGNRDKARDAWEKTLAIDPAHQAASQGMNALRR